MQNIIVVTGLPGSGKTTVADYIESKYNAKVLHTGDIIRDEIKRRGLKYTPENDAKIAHWFHTGGREKLVVRRIWDRASKSRKKIIVIEGFRSYSQMKILEKMSKTRPSVISVEASQIVRVKRELSRGRFGKAESVKYVKFRDKLEKSHGIGELMANADHRIDNTHLSVRQSNYATDRIMHMILSNQI